MHTNIANQNYYLFNSVYIYLLQLFSTLCTGYRAIDFCLLPSIFSTPVAILYLLLLFLVYVEHTLMKAYEQSVTENIKDFILHLLYDTK